MLEEQEIISKHDRYLTGLSVWALAFGCVIGWGAFVMPGKSFLPDAGPVGTIIGIIIAAIFAFIICFNYSWLVNKFPDSGSSYLYTKNIMGEDHAFFVAWSLELAYISLLWANATAFSVIARYSVGDYLQCGQHYNIAGYNVYMGEVIFTIVILFIFGLISCYLKRLADYLRIFFGIVLVSCVSIVFIALVKNVGFSKMFTPAFSLINEPIGIQILNVAVLAPWMFVGFETVSHSVGKVRFPIKRIFKYAFMAIFIGMIMYIMLSLAGTAEVSNGYSNWYESVTDKNFHAPRLVFNIVDKVLGKWGLSLLSIAAFSALATGVLGFHNSASWILQIMAEANLLPKKFAEINKDGIPTNAGLLVLILSIPIPFLGRTAIGWNCDVSTLSVAIVYAYISICVLKTTNSKENKLFRTFGYIGVFSSLVIFFFLLVPNIFAVNALEKESYFMLAIWSLLGILYYWFIFKNDKDHRFGKSTIMWLMMLFLLFFSANIGVRLDTETRISILIKNNKDLLNHIMTENSSFQLFIVIIALFIMFNLFKTMLRREKELDYQIIESESRNKAKSEFLSNMSHDIRTPMNAIIGFTDLALLNTKDSEMIKEYLTKIKASSAHLLALINDVLEMSRIESGKIELNQEEINLPEIIHNLNSIIIGQVGAKQQDVYMDAINVIDENVICDRLRLNQVLLNLISNAIKYTPAGGKIELSISQKNSALNGKAFYEFKVKDNGIGMKQEFAERIFEAFEREKTATVEGIQGTGLGMAITKKIVDLMGGKIIVKTAPGEGSEFIVDLELKIGEKSRKDYTISDLKGVKALVVDDDYNTCDSVTNMLIEMGLDAEWTMHGKEAVIRAKQANSRGKSFGVYIIDWKLPDLSGIEVTRQIRKEIPDKTPILLISALDWASIKDEAKEAGVNGFCNKPLFASELYSLLNKILENKDKEEKITDENKLDTINFVGKRLLLVDDMLINRQIASLMLKMYGFEIEEASDGEEAVIKVQDAEAGYFDAVLMDIQMPNMNGYEAATAIRKLEDKNKASVPLIAMTANAFDEDKKKAIEAGMNGHLAKPIDRVQLVNILKEII